MVTCRGHKLHHYSSQTTTTTYLRSPAIAGTVSSRSACSWRERRVWHRDRLSRQLFDLKTRRTRAHSIQQTTEETWVSTSPKHAQSTCPLTPLSVYKGIPEIRQQVVSIMAEKKYQCAVVCPRHTRPRRRRDEERSKGHSQIKFRCVGRGTPTDSKHACYNRDNVRHEDEDEGLTQKKGDLECAAGGKHRVTMCSLVHTCIRMCCSANSKTGLFSTEHNVRLLHGSQETTVCRSSP